MKKVMMNDQVEDKNPGAAALFGSSAPSSNVSPSSSEASSTAPSWTGFEKRTYFHTNKKAVKLSNL